MRRGIVLVACFAGALAAGFLGGVAYSSWKHARRVSFMANQLDLSAEQAKAMKAIWDESMKERHRLYREESDAVKARRIEKVKALVGEASAGAYEEILAAEKAERDALRLRSQEIFEAAEKKTMALLNESQREKYAKFLAESRERGERSERGPEGEQREHGDVARDTSEGGMD